MNRYYTASQEVLTIVKILVRGSSIYAMAMSRKNAIDKLESIKPTLEEHIMKLAVYDDQFNCKDHWIKEIASFLSIANDLTTKYSNGKLSSKDYLEHLVGGLGDTKKDASVNVRLLKFKIDRTKEYPSFEITRDIVDKAFEISQVVSEFVKSILPTKNNFRTNDIYSYLVNHIDNSNEDVYR